MALPKIKLPTSYEVCVSPQERLIAAVGRNVVVADLLTRKRIASWHAFSHPDHVAFSPDEKLLAIKNTSGEVAILDLATGDVRARSRPKIRDEGAAIYFSPCGTCLVDGSWSGKIRVRKVDDLSVVNEFAFPGEMITEVSASLDGSRWMFGHKPKTPADAQFGAPPYLSIWTWPFREPLATIPSSFDNVYAAQLAPSAQHVAVVGHCRANHAHELRLLALSGDVVASAAVSLGGTGSKTRWSRDSRLIGTIAAHEFRVLAVPTLNTVASIPAEYPSDIAFIGNNTEVFLGSWKWGRVDALRCDA
jgi:hypothetical protein